jgi:hypothetical protein
MIILSMKMTVGCFIVYTLLDKLLKYYNSFICFLPLLLRDDIFHHKDFICAPPYLERNVFTIR